MNLLINLNTNNSDIPTFLLKNCIKSERKGNNIIFKLHYTSAS